MNLSKQELNALFEIFDVYGDEAFINSHKANIKKKYTFGEEQDFQSEVSKCLWLHEVCLEGKNYLKSESYDIKQAEYTEELISSITRMIMFFSNLLTGTPKRSNKEMIKTFQNFTPLYKEPFPNYIMFDDINIWSLIKKFAEFLQFQFQNFKESERL